MTKGASKPKDVAALKQASDRLAREYGPWFESVLLAEGVHTGSGQAGAKERRLKAVLQVAADAIDHDLHETRVLDLGAGEGRYAVEFASHGAEVVALEAREGNVQKARFLRDAFGLERLNVVQADVRSLSGEAHGDYDIVLCLGILYHLEATEVVRLVHTLADITRRLVVFDTHVAMAARSRVTIDGRTYWGRRIREFHPRTPPETQERLSRSSIGNAESFWLTRASLFNLLSDAGFTSVAEVHVPRARSTGDRVTLLAFRGTPRTVISAPDAEGLDARWPERERDTVHSSATWRGAVKVRLAPHIPAPLKRCVRWLRTRR